MEPTAAAPLGASPASGSAAAQSAESAAPWLTVSQAAARLGISARTVRRRCESGQLAARLVSTESGKKWFVSGAELDALPGSSGQTPAKNGRSCGQAADRATATIHAGKAKLRPEMAGATDSSGQGVARAADTMAGAPATAQSADLGAERAVQWSELTAQAEQLRAERDAALKERDREREEVEFLRARVAELNAVVMQTARALPGAAAQERPAVQAGAVPQPQRTGDGFTGAQDQTLQLQAEKRAPRPLWKVLLGIRRD